MNIPPRILLWLLDKLGPRDRPDLKGDFLELYDRRVNEIGKGKANRKFLADTIGLIPLTFISRRHPMPKTTIYMLGNYLKIAYRNLVKHKIFSTINIIGLSFGMAASLLLLQYVSFEFSYDRFHPGASNIYRVILNSYKGGVFEFSNGVSYYKGAPAMMESYPQVENYVRLHRADGMMNYYDGSGKVVSYFEKSGFYTDSSFFSVFNFPLIKGNKNSVLRNDNTMLMSESAARKYFGYNDPIGKVIELSTEWAGGAYVVEGIFKDVPENSHLKFDFLFSIKRLLVNQQFVNGGWYWQNFYNYLVLKPGTDVKDLESRISGLLDKHVGWELKEANRKQEYKLQPLTEIHLRSNIGYEIGANGNYQLVYFILIVALLIMGIAWLNYINLSTAKALERAKEVGIRKVMGSERAQLIQQFLFESFLLVLLSVIVAAVLLVILKPLFVELVGKDMAIDLLAQKKFWLVVASILGIGTFLSAFYPALVLSSAQPIRVLKGKYIGNIATENIRKTMVVFQFASAILLIVATFTISRQISFLQEQDLGMSINQRLIVRAPRIVKGESEWNAMKGFKNLLSQSASIQGVTTSSEVPGREIFWSNDFRLTHDSDEKNSDSKILAVDEDFISTYDIQLIAGRNFSVKRPADFGGSVIINEAEMAMLGINDPAKALGERVQQGDHVPKEIIGVIKDFQQEFLKKSSVPIVLQFMPWHNDYITVSLNSQQMHADVEQVIKTYKKIFPDNAIEYFFLDDYFNAQYKSEEQFWNIFRVFSALAISIACIGLFGLSLVVISRRTKEVGIRKVLGSTEAGIVALLSKDFLKLVLLAFILTIPIAWFVMNKWLEGFAHRITIPVWIYCLSGGITVVIALMTVSFQAIKAALANPTKSLNTE